MNTRSRAALFSLVVVMAACGGGGSAESGISEAEAVAAIRTKLSEESTKLTERITAKVEEATASVGGLTCTSTHIDLAQTMVSTEIMQGLDEFNRWVLAYQGATQKLKYEIGKVLDASTLPEQSEIAYKAAFPCAESLLLASAATISQYAVYEVVSVKDSLRRAGLLAP